MPLEVGDSTAEIQTIRTRGLERNRRVLLTVVASVGARAVQAVTVLVTVPLALHYLREARYGLWTTISSIVGLLAFADLGIGNGVLTAVADAHGRNDRASAREAVSTAFFLLLGIGAIIAILFTSTYTSVTWGTIFNVRGAVAEAEISATVLVVVLCFALSLPLSIVQRVQAGYQEGAASSVWQALGFVIGLIGIVVVIRANAGAPALVLAASGGPVLALALNSIVQFARTRRWLSPSIGAFTLSATRRLAASGSLFFFAQLGALLLMSAPNLAIARLLGATAVTPYAVAMRPIQILTLLTSIWAAPLWPAYTEARARGDWNWIVRTFRMSLSVTLIVSTLLGAAFFASYKSVITFWIGTGPMPTQLTVVAGCVFLLANGVRWVVSVCLNGLNHLLGQVWYQMLAAAAAIACAVPLANRFGVGGVAISFAVGEVLVSLCLITEVWAVFRASGPTATTAELARYETR
jgi:O-antigen/teichoic acid export membrane protein